jgi:hypothetical protein
MEPTIIDDDGGPSVGDLLAENRPFHSEFQIERFIIGQGRTVWGMFHQALRELRTRVDALKADYVAIRRAELDVADTMIDLDRQGEAKLGDRTLERVRLRLAEKRAVLEGLKAICADREREAAVVLGFARRLKAKVGNPTPAERYCLDGELWAAKLTDQAARELHGNGRVSPATLEAIGLLPGTFRVDILTRIDDDPVGMVQDWQDAVLDVPGGDPGVDPAVDIRGLIQGPQA